MIKKPGTEKFNDSLSNMRKRNKNSKLNKKVNTLLYVLLI